jgi:hypothetical protein
VIRELAFKESTNEGSAMRRPRQPKRPYDDDDDDERPRVDREGRDRAVITEIVKRRLEGGEPPTAEAYARALEQWQKLPGAAVRDPGTVTEKQPPDKPDDSRAVVPEGQNAADDESR